VTFLDSRIVAAIALSSSAWAIINAYMGPIFWAATSLPFLCDILGFSSLILVAWWTKRFGAITLTGLVATLINFLVGGNVFFLGFTVASIVFDVATRAAGYGNLFSRPFISHGLMIFLAAASASVAGFIIAPVFMNMQVLSGIVTFAGLHALGGVLGGVAGLSLVKALEVRRVLPA
jgi:hypothetical protein